MPHLPSHGGSKNGSPDMRLAASNLSLGSQNGGPTQVGGRDIVGVGGGKKFSDSHHLPTIWQNLSQGTIITIEQNQYYLVSWN